MGSKRNIAFLIIHGAGPHQSYSVLDAFVRGFREIFEDKYQIKEIDHKLRSRHNWLGQGMDWTESYISMLVDEGNTIDFYEYFWDIFMVHQASLNESVKLLIKASDGARKYYKDHTLLKENVPLAAYTRKKKLGFSRKKEIAPAGYLKMLGWLGVILSKLWIFRPFAWIILFWANTHLPILKQIFAALGRLVEKVTLQVASDGVVYLNLDPRSQHFETRQHILDGITEEIKELMEHYDAIILAGHSLGSVIAYDSINRIIQQTNAENGEIPLEKAEKIKGLITFGSPLDKLAVFFRENRDKDTPIRNQILTNLHSFRINNPYTSKDEKDIGNPMKYDLPQTVWLNFYHQKDKISDELSLYDLENHPPNHLKTANIRVNRKVRGLFEAHSSYWGTKLKVGEESKNVQYEMYVNIINEFFPD